MKIETIEKALIGKTFYRRRGLKADNLGTITSVGKSQNFNDAIIRTNKGKGLITTHEKAVWLARGKETESYPEFCDKSVVDVFYAK